MDTTHSIKKQNTLFEVRELDRDSRGHQRGYRKTRHNSVRANTNKKRSSSSRQLLLMDHANSCGTESAPSLKSLNGSTPRATSWYFDEEFPIDERIPRSFKIEFDAISDGALPAIRLLYEGRQIGDTLTDNSHKDDGYRFHDVFHFAHAVMLGWSPMIRKLFECKRKSVPRIDEVEDGARARILEEAVCAIVFEYARKREFLAGAESVQDDLLQTLCDLTQPFEVRSRTKDDWNETILKSYAVWREMRRHEGGYLIGDLDRRTIEFFAI